MLELFAFRVKLTFLQYAKRLVGNLNDSKMMYFLLSGT